MKYFAGLADCRALESEMPWEDRNVATTMYEFLSQAAAKHGPRNAVTFQLQSGPKDQAETLTWSQLHARTCQCANLFRDLGIGPNDTVAYILPNCNETVVALLGGMIAGVVNPINALLDPEHMAALLRETGAKVVVTLRAFPKTDVPQNVARAVAMVPDVETVLEVDLLRYLTPPKSWIVPLIRPKNPPPHKAKILSFNAELDKQPTTPAFKDVAQDRVAALFHTGGTTGMPKVARHRYSGMIYNGWIGHTLLFGKSDTVICPLPLFHVFACHVVTMSMIASGGHVVFPTPAGYRGDGVFDNFWKLIERWNVTFIIGVPTAFAALMQRPVDADISSIKSAFSGSSPLPVEIFKRFEKATDVGIVEGYGLTEATCLVSCNPTAGAKKVGSIGVPLPYTDLKIFNCSEDGTVKNELGVDEVGEICVANPGVVIGHTYSEASKNVGLFADRKYLRTGDLGRIDEDGYVWITGRAKDLIIRGGHNIDPAEIEEALAGHPAVAFVGAIGQPDSFAGELPCAYVELVEGADVTTQELMAFANEHVHERAARPKYLEILDELPKTAVGKIFKPDLRGRAITRVYNDAFAQAGQPVIVEKVVEDKKRGLVAQLRSTGETDKQAVQDLLEAYTRPWEWTP